LSDTTIIEFLESADQRRKSSLCARHLPSCGMSHDASHEHEVERWSPLKVWFYTLFHRHPKSNTAIVDFAKVGQGDRFLDVGCGPGAALIEAVRAGAVAAGIDPSPSMVERAARRAPEADVRVGSAEEIPFGDDVFTVAVNVASFHHWADRDGGLEEIRRVLVPGGRLYVMEGKIGDGEDGHGLGRSDTRLLMERLGELGYADARTDSLRTGWRHEYFVVSAINPG